MAIRSYEYNKEYVKFAQQLRTNMTKQEKALWYDFLSLLPVTAHRQKNIGNYIVDFYIPESKTVIEVDGIDHIDPEKLEKDRERDYDLRDMGITVLRFKNYEITGEFLEVKKAILEHLGLDNEETYAYISQRYDEKMRERKKRFYKKFTKRLGWRCFS